MDDHLSPSHSITQNDYECYAYTDNRVAEAIAASTKRQQRNYFAGGKWKSVNRNKATTSSPVVAKPSKVQMISTHLITSKAKSTNANVATTNVATTNVATTNAATTNAATASVTSSPKATVIVDLTASATSSPKATIIIDLTVPL
jgi:hypothetical protein